MLTALHDLSEAASPNQGVPVEAGATERHAPNNLRGSAPASPLALPAQPGSAQILPFPLPATLRVSQARAALPGQALARLPGPSLDGTRAAPLPRPLATTHPLPAEVARCLTVADRMALLAWGSHGGGGYARVVLEEGIPGAAPDHSGYVLLYRCHDRWATLGLTRRVTGILVWRCSDGTALGTYPTMAAALAALPPAASLPQGMAAPGGTG